MLVLVADDDRFIRTTLTDILVEFGHSVILASDGIEAVEMSTNTLPDVIILDLLMPRISGLDALKAMRAWGVDAPIILLSAISDISIRHLHGVHAADACIEKPFTPDAISKALSEAIEHRSIRARAARA